MMRVPYHGNEGLYLAGEWEMISRQTDCNNRNKTQTALIQTKTE